MKQAHIRMMGIFLFFLGVFFLIGSNAKITGAVVGLTSYSSSLTSIFGVISMLGSVLLLLSQKSEEDENKKLLEARIRNHELLTREELHKFNLTVKQLTFRKKLLQLLALTKQPDMENNKKIAYLLPYYDKVRDSHEHTGGEHHNHVYQGRERNKEEYFSVDIREMVDTPFGHEIRKLPHHIDLQKRISKNHYRQIMDKYGKPVRKDIDWDSLVHNAKAEDIVSYINYKNEKRKMLYKRKT